MNDEAERSGIRLAFAVCQKPYGAVSHFARNPVPFPVLVDADRSTAKAYGVWVPIGPSSFNIARPATFVIDRERIVRYVHVGRGRTDRVPLEEALGAAQRLDRDRPGRGGSR